jgi:hypothetical protein
VNSDLLCKALLGTLAVMSLSCSQEYQEIQNSQSGMSNDVRWTIIKSDIVDEINRDLRADHPTVDVGIYYPSNLDESFIQKFSLDELLNEFVAAKKIFGAAGVQLKLLWVKSAEVDPGFLSIQSNDMSGATPGSQYANMYRDMLRRGSSLSRDARTAFDALIEHHDDNHRTVYLVVLQHVFMSFFEQVDERTWEKKTITTGGLSFPSYIHVDNIPRRLRGAITITRNDALDKLVAHELGHKLLNVSHEYKEMNPQHEIRAEGGLMIYGSGTEILSGEKGRWHRERLHLSPFVYRQATDGSRIWNDDYLEGGHYYDPLYGNNVVNFSIAPADAD